MLAKCSLIVLAGALATGCMNDGGDDRQMSDRGQGEERSASARMSGERVDKGKVEQMTANWPAPSRKALTETMNKYGPPNELTPTHAVWWNNGPWKYTKISSMPVDHY